MAVITVRINEELKRKMKACRHVNWSHIVREAIVRQIEVEEREASTREIDELRRKVKPVKAGELARWLREDRTR